MLDLQKIASERGWIFKNKNSLQSIRKIEYLVIIILAKWSNVDIKTIDAIKPVIDNLKYEVVVVDIDDFVSQEEIKGFFPEFPMITQTPILACFKHGKLISFIEGDDVKGFVGEIMN